MLQGGGSSLAGQAMAGLTFSHASQIQMVTAHHPNFVSVRTKFLLLVFYGVYILWCVSCRQTNEKDIRNKKETELHGCCLCISKTPIGSVFKLQRA